MGGDGAKLGHTDRLVILKKPFDNIEVLQLAGSLARKWQLHQESKARLADLERLVAERTAELVRAQKMESIGQLASGIAHEINTPAQYVGDNTRFLKDSFATLQDHDLLSRPRAGGETKRSNP